jgi:hypothetical protein
MSQASSKSSMAYFSILYMEAVHSSETLVNIYQTTQRNTPEDSALHIFTEQTDPSVV